MREILFKAKAANREEGREYRTNYKNGDWVYGLVTSLDNYYLPNIAEMKNTDGVSGIEVEKETICQWTGLVDKNGVKVFEGDLVKAFVRDVAMEKEYIDSDLPSFTLKKKEAIWTVEYKQFTGSMGFMVYGKDRRFHIPLTWNVIYNNGLEVIGSIHDKAVEE